MRRQLLTDFYLPWNTHLRNPKPISETPGYPKAELPLWPPRKRCLKNLSCSSLKSNCILPFKTIPDPYTAVSLLLMMTFTSSTGEVGSQTAARAPIWEHGEPPWSHLHTRQMGWVLTLQFLPPPWIRIKGFFTHTQACTHTSPIWGTRYGIEVSMVPSPRSQACPADTEWKLLSCAYKTLSNGRCMSRTNALG